MRRAVLTTATTIAVAAGLLAVPAQSAPAGAPASNQASNSASKPAGAVGAVGAPAAPRDPDRRLPQGDSGLDVYAGTVSTRELDAFAAVGVDRQDLVTGRSGAKGLAVEAILTAGQARSLRAGGVDLRLKRVDGRSTAKTLTREVRRGDGVYRSYSEPGGIRDELIRTARRNPGLAELVRVGTTVQGQQILAVRITKDAPDVADGSRPAVLYTGAQHAREWITPEMTRRLMLHVLDRYGESPRITRLVDTTEMWFVPVANPDGYDFTFTRDNRLWRKNLRDNNGDGQIAPGDGVDLNRNAPFKWGWDNEGSSPDPASETYRGSGPASEPETRALVQLTDRVGFEFYVNYHSAAELLLYGTGWQVSTPAPDDQIQEAMVGTDDNPAVPGYDPDISAELYTTNGDLDSHLQEKFGTLGFTPEMTTCETVSASDPDDQWEPEDCLSGFNFPDDEQLIRAEFRKNIPFALSVASSADDPDDPESSVGLEAPDLVADSFNVSFGNPQPVAVVAKRALDGLRLNYAVNGGAPQQAATTEWPGGERYGNFSDRYYAEFRGIVRGTQPGDSVRVWFSGQAPGAGRVSSDPFTYKVHPRIGGDVLVLAAEDVTGDSPTQAAAGGNARYADDFRRRLRKAGYQPNTYDVDRLGRTAPHHLGVLHHYDAVVWETGNDIIPRELGQPAGTAAELALDLELTNRDYLNEGGKLLLTGKYNQFAQAADGVYFYNPFEEEQGECTTYGVYPCLPLLNDFQQYWLGAYNYVTGGGQDADGNPYDVAGQQGAFAGFEGRLNGGNSANNQDHTASLLTTSSFLPPTEFPQFASAAPLEWARPGAAPYDPFTGDWYVYSQQDDISYKRLTRTVDMTGASTGNLTFRTSYDTETDWDYLFVEARPVGTDNWTTLPDENGNTAQGTGESCAGGWVQRLHPHLAHYMNRACEPTGTTGEWHAATGRSGGWQEWSVDLSQYAGEQVEVHVAYASDDAVQGLGVFVDDTAVEVDGTVVDETSFEQALDGWSVTGPPAGSAPNSNDWVRSQSAFEEGSGVTTDDTVFVGFGAEGLRTRAMRVDFVRRAMEHLLG